MALNRMWAQLGTAWSADLDPANQGFVLSRPATNAVDAKEVCAGAASGWTHSLSFSGAGPDCSSPPAEWTSQRGRADRVCWACPSPRPDFLEPLLAKPDGRHVGGGQRAQQRGKDRDRGRRHAPSAGDHGSARSSRAGPPRAKPSTNLIGSVQFPGHADGGGCPPLATAKRCLGTAPSPSGELVAPVTARFLAHGNRCGMPRAWRP